MVSWLAKQLMARNMTRLNTGDPGPTLRLEAEAVRFRFPGESSWSGEFHGKREVRQWLERFASVGIQIFPDEVVVKGFPWNQTVCVRGRDHLDAADGQRIYENRYVIWGRMGWGKLKEYEVYEDTAKAQALDDYLAVHERPPLAAS